MRPARLSSLLSSMSANVVDEQPTLYVCHLVLIQGLPFSIVAVPVPVLKAKSCCPVQELLCGTILYLLTPTHIDVVAVDVKQRQQREVPLIAIHGTLRAYNRTGTPPATPAEQVLIWYDR